MSARINEVIFDPLEKELLGAIRAPAPPFWRVISQLETIRMPGPIEAAALACFAYEKEDPNTTIRLCASSLPTSGIQKFRKLMRGRTQPPMRFSQIRPSRTL
jgi:hypothetical protein